MFLEERHQQILELLQQNGKVIVKDLSAQFNVTEGMIRKDLQVLEQRGKLKRTYGGAIVKREILHDEVLQERVDKNLDAKNVIAREVEKLIPVGCSVFLDSSSTNLVVARELIRRNKFNRIITNMPQLVALFPAENPCELFLLGGRVDKRLGGVVGLEAVNTLKKHQIDIAVLGVAGIDLNKGIVTNFDSEEGLTKHAAIESAKKTIITLEKEKFHHDGGFSFANLKEIDILVCDQGLRASEVEFLNALEIEVVIPNL